MSFVTAAGSARSAGKISTRNASEAISARSFCRRSSRRATSASRVTPRAASWRANSSPNPADAPVDQRACPGERVGHPAI